MPLALELMNRGSYQVEMSDEDLMTEDVEDCLGVVIEAVTTCSLPAEEALAWCSAMLDADRVGFIARKPLEALRGRVQAAKAKVPRPRLYRRPTGPALPRQRAVSAPGRAVHHPNAHRPLASPGMRRTVITRLPKGHDSADEGHDFDQPGGRYA
jgi:hypothetical protein